tara:strand:+ start:435 stop:761 length:327 start_codon:yes stop_codon:yes gene_type:complete
MGQTLRERMEIPDGTSDDREIWETMRTWMVILRVLIVVATIIIVELFEEYFILNLSVSVWAIIVGVPAFLLFSMLIIQGDKRLAPDLEAKRQSVINKTVLKRPIRQRE